jgi:AraC family transcriptional regulator
VALAERTDARLSPIDRLLHRSASVAVGAFRCPRGHALFADSGPIENDVFVFPRRRVFIAHAGGGRFLADPTLVTLYNRGQAYARTAVDDVDHSDYFAVDRTLALELVRERDPDVAERPFRFEHAPAAPALHFRQRLLFERLARGEVVDTLEVEETVLALLAGVLAGAYASRRQALAPPECRGDQEVAREARLLSGATFRQERSLGAMAQAVGTSRARLCRVFRRVTGTTLHAYREQLRLRAALEALASGTADLTELALDLGYSSHSHFSANFRRWFGLSPSAARERLSAGAGRTGPPRRRIPAPP